MPNTQRGRLEEKRGKRKELIRRGIKRTEKKGNKMGKKGKAKMNMREAKEKNQVEDNMKKRRKK